MVKAFSSDITYLRFSKCLIEYIGLKKCKGLKPYKSKRNSRYWEIASGKFCQKIENGNKKGQYFVIKYFATKLI